MCLYSIEIFANQTRVTDPRQRGISCTTATRVSGCFSFHVPG